MSAGATVLCVLVDAGLLVAATGGLNPEAVALLGTAVRLDAELALSPLGQRVEVVLEDDGSGVVAAARTLAEREFPTVGSLSDAAQFCAPGATRIVLARASALETDDATWVLGDAYFGLADIADANRRFREVLGVPVPRPLPPDMITGELVRLPGDTDQRMLLRAIYDAERTSWAILGGQVVLYSENSDQIDELLAMPGVIRLSHAVHLTRLRLVNRVPEGATALLRLNGMTLVEADSEIAEGMSWRELRFATLS